MKTLEEDYKADPNKYRLFVTATLKMTGNIVRIQFREELNGVPYFRTATNHGWQETLPLSAFSSFKL